MRRYIVTKWADGTFHAFALEETGERKPVLIDDGEIVAVWFVQSQSEEDALQLASRS